MAAPVVEFQDISRRYGALRAVDGVSFSVSAGEAFGLLGPNRAGKTTLVKMLLSLTRPTSGRVSRFGLPASDRSTLARVGYMHENHAFPRYLSARELLGYYGAMSLVPLEPLCLKVEELLAKVGLLDRAADPVRTYSKGMVQRLGLAQALVNDPELLVLDEPTEGLDLEGRRLLRCVVADLKARGRTVLLVSHVLPEVEALCDRAAVVVRGTLKHVGPLAALKGSRPLEDALAEMYA
ncbi:MAG: ABC transporter ATP-binding protein [Gemmataceae bacterium]|nr:ABC transporter ATP-binding protein [Gemmataceae bacterium]